MRSIVITILTILLLAACHEQIQHETMPDAAPDAAVDAAGSGSVATFMEPSPRDFKLELVVLGASLVVAVAPIRGVRRRRRKIANKSQL
jgi:hypothetical protein